MSYFEQSSADEYVKLKIFNQDNLSYVYVVSSENKISKKKIEVGIKIDGMVEILKGINADDLVVYEGINKIRDGSAVKIK